MAKKKPAPKKSAFREYVEAIAIALSVALFLRFFIVEAFKIPSGSMIGSLLIGDHIFVNKMVYRTELPYSLLGVRLPGGGTTLWERREPERGEVVVFRYPNDPGTDYIKRVVGVPGDTIEVRNNQIILNGEPVPQEYVSSYGYDDDRCGEQQASRFLETNGAHSYYALTTRGGGLYQNYGPVEIQPGNLFVMGDNRDHSSDSRAWGQVPIRNVKGRAMFIWLSVDRCNGLASRFRWGRFGMTLDADEEHAE